MNERKYARRVARLIQGPAMQLLDERLLPILAKYAARQDSIVTDSEQDEKLRSELETAIEQAASVHQVMILPEATAVTRRTVAEVDRRNQLDIDAQLAAAATQQQKRKIGAAIARRTLGVDPIGREPWLQKVTQKTVGASLEHIQWATQETYRRATSIVSEGLSRGLRYEAVAQSLRKNFAESMEMGSRRAAFIARNELGNLVSDLTEARHTDLGITSYRWRTAGDERVRGPGGKYPKAKPSHRAREGKIYQYDNPPNEGKNDGHPGRPYNCRCTAEPIFDALEPSIERKAKREAPASRPERAAPATAPEDFGAPASPTPEPAPPPRLSPEDLVSRYGVAYEGTPPPVLSAPEAHAVQNYTRAFHNQVNGALRAPEGAPADSFRRDMLGFAGLIDSALTKLPKHVGRVHRGVSLSGSAAEAYLAEHEAALVSGAPVTYRGLTSTSTLDDGFQTRIQLRIHSRTGRKIQDLSVAPNEAEVLFRVGTSFQVLRIDRGPQFVFIEMAEVEQ